MTTADLLAKIPLFQGLPEAQREKLAWIASSQALDRGALIFSDGDDASGFYVVLSGRIKIYKLAPDGKEQILHLFGPGEPFGEVPVFTGERFPAHAEAMEKSSILYFPRAAFIELVRQEPSLALNMLAVLSKRLRLFTHLIESLSLKEVPGRLAAYLLYLSDRSDDPSALRLDIPKGQLASLLGTIPETLSRILGRMAGQGIVEVEGRAIRLLDRSALEELAEGAKLL
ncbi:MAG: Crp/Fnr family transcriptional regulator [Syntrophobacteraceae bacterium]